MNCALCDDHVSHLLATGTSRYQNFPTSEVVQEKKELVCAEICNTIAAVEVE